MTENDERTKLENELLELEGEYHRLLFGEQAVERFNVPSDPFSTNKRLMIKATQMLYSTFKIINAMNLTNEQQQRRNGQNKNKC